jgi:hypothetical protein
VQISNGKRGGRGRRKDEQRSTRLIPHAQVLQLPQLFSPTNDSKLCRVDVERSKSRSKGDVDGREGVVAEAEDAEAGHFGSGIKGGEEVVVYSRDEEAQHGSMQGRRGEDAPRLRVESRRSFSRPETEVIVFRAR